MPAVRRKEVVLLRADPDVEDRPDSLVFQLRPVGRGQVKQKSIARTLAHELRIELRGHLGSDFVTATTDALADARLDAAASVLPLHEPHRRRSDSCTRAAPARVHESGNLPLRIPEHDRVAVRKRGKERYAWAIGEQRIDVVD